MKIKWQVPAFVALAALLGIALQFGCEGTGGVDTDGVDSYFANHPYVSDPRDPTSPSDVTISPASATVSYIGQAITFTAKGGSGDYHWGVVNSDGHISSIVSQEHSTSTAIYIADIVAVNSVIVYDKYGHSAIASVSIFTASSLLIAPTSTTLTNSFQVVVFLASGGLPPYTWSVGDSTKGSLDSTTGTSVAYKRTNAGDNSVHVQDSAGDSASAAVSQP